MNEQQNIEFKSQLTHIAERRNHQAHWSCKGRTLGGGGMKEKYYNFE